MSQDNKVPFFYDIHVFQFVWKIEFSTKIKLNSIPVLTKYITISTRSFFFLNLIPFDLLHKKQETKRKMIYFFPFNKRK